jgi:hypothetical protein
MFALRGLHGQNIFVDPAGRLVLVQTAVHKEPVPSNAELLALWEGLVKAFGD